MIWCIQQIAPTADLYNYLQAFIREAAKNAECNPRKPALLTQVLVSLNAANVDEKELSVENVPVTITLIDQSRRKIKIAGSCNFRQLCNRLADQLFLKDATDFACFVAVDGLPQPRLIPDNSKVGPTKQKWLEVKEKTGREVHFLFKRRMLMPDEVLSNNDPVHASLTYKQAVHDFLKYPVAEERGVVVRIAANVLWDARSSFTEAIAEAKLGDEGVLEQILPWDTLKETEKRATVVKETEKRAT